MLVCLWHCLKSILVGCVMCMHNKHTFICDQKSCQESKSWGDQKPQDCSLKLKDAAHNFFLFCWIYCVGHSRPAEPTPCSTAIFSLESFVKFISQSYLISFRDIPRHQTGWFLEKVIPDICHFFSTYVIFGLIFLHTKVRKSRQNRIRDKMA